LRHFLQEGERRKGREMENQVADLVLNAQNDGRRRDPVEMYQDLTCMSDKYMLNP
jgi:hypothetical protein